MATLKYVPQYFSTTLNVGGGIDASQTTGIILQSVSGLDIAKPGQICVSYSDPIDTGVAEWINYTSINGSNELVGVTRGCEGYSAHTHVQGATVQFTLSATHLNDLNDVVNGIKGKELTTTAGGTTTYTLTPPTAVAAYVTGAEFNIKMNASNTGASTINISGLGAKSLTKGGATALASGDLLIDGVYKITYDGTQFQVSGISAATSTSPRVVSAASYTTDTGTSLSVATADVFIVTAQAGGLLFNAPGGSPAQAQKLIIRIKDDGTARALTYNAVFRASSDLPLPTTTVLSKTLYMGFIYNSTDTKWDLLAVMNNL